MNLSEQASLSADEERQRLCRDVNEEIRRRLAHFDPDQTLLFVCECIDPDCAEPVECSLRCFNRIRRSPGRYLIASGHRD